MHLSVHLLIHLATSILAGYIAYWLFKKQKSVKKNLLVILFTAFLGGFLVDLDHLFDYFVAFGFNFRLDYFLKGYEFMKIDKIYVLLHGWEFVALLLILGFWYKNKKRFFQAVITIALALGLTSHLIIDTALNNVKPQTYFFLYRLYHNFDLKELVSEENYIKHMEGKKSLPFLYE